MKKAWLALLFGSALVLGACGGGEDDAKKDQNDQSSTESSTESNATTSEGEKIVMESCVTCHGGQLQGMGNTPALNNVGSRLSEDEILDVILNGRNGMPGGLLKEDSAKEAAAWLAQQK